MKRRRNNYQKITTAGACLGVVLGSATGAMAQDSSVEQLTKENQELKARMDALEAFAKKEGVLPSGQPAPKFVSAMSDISISGFVQASYFYNTAHPADGVSDAYLWNAKDNSFSINKVKVTIAGKPVERSGEEWGASFRTSLIWGEDSGNLNTGSPGAGFEALREAYVELNAPIGTGLNIKAGQLISLLNWESGDGGAANPNFSQGNQWWYTGNGPSAGVQLGYTFTDKVSLNVRVQNGLFAGPVDSNEGKAFIGSLAFKPTDKLWVNFIGWFDDQGPSGPGLNPPAGFPKRTDCAGVSSIGGYKVSDKLGTGWELDYFNFSGTTGGTDIWSVGGWAWYDFTSKVGVAFRADFIEDTDGILGPPMRGAASQIASPVGGAITDADGNLASFTLTLNLKPTANLKIQPEIRYDTTSYTGGLDGKKDRVTIGAGVTYMF